jgi:hypothetical protein
LFYLSAFSFAEMANPENTKLCDFTSMKNSDFICTPIAPPAPAYEIKPDFTTRDLARRDTILVL